LKQEIVGRAVLAGGLGRDQQRKTSTTVRASSLPFDPTSRRRLYLDLGSPSLRRTLCIDNNPLFICTRSIRSNKIPGHLAGHCIHSGGMQQWRSVHVLLAYRVRSYGRVAEFVIPALLPQNSYTGPSGLDDGDQCKCNTVLYNLISACDACQGGSWTPCVDQLLFSPGF
jgi:hypothetical protein